MALETLVKLAGMGQFCLVAGSVFIPKCLNWKDAIGNANKLTRQLFLTYACYILGMHLFFGLISAFAANELLNGGFLGTALCALMTAWWGLRIVLQFCCFDRTCIPKTKFNCLAEGFLVLLFISLTSIYGMALWRNLL